MSKSQQRKVISLRFRLKDGKVLTLTQIGEWLNISRDSMCQLYKQALEQLRLSLIDLQQYKTC